MHTATISTLTEFVSTVEAIVASNGAFNTWWRGQAAHGAGWDLVAGVFRKLVREHDMVYDFMQRAFPRYSDCPRWEDRVGWLFLMQHYHVPTRLLDWTESPLIAAFFACLEEEHYDKDGVVWGVNPFELNRAMVKKAKTVGLYNEDDPDLTILINGPFVSFGEWAKLEPITLPLAGPAMIAPDGGTTGVATTSQPYVICPYRTHGLAVVPDTALETVAALNSVQRNTRMLAQMSRFTLHGDGTPLNRIDRLEACFVRITIAADAKRAMLNALQSFGIRRSSIFPDLEHLAEETKVFRGFRR